jgi:ABC-type transport system substrate-binding protein
MEMEKKNLAIIILAVVLAASGVGNVILAIMAGLVEVGIPEKKTLVVGFVDDPVTIDAITSWDLYSNQIIMQVCEKLVDYDISDHPNYFVKGVLAESWKWHGANFDEVSFKLQEGVKFHDNTTFDADDVVWNVERMMWFANYTGYWTPANTNLTAHICDPAELFWFADGVTPIMDTIVKNSQYNVTFNLNAPFAQFVDLMCYNAWCIYSPDSTPQGWYLSLTEDMIGTGPYTYDGFTTDVEVRYSRYDEYWGDSPYFDEVVFVINKDDISRNEAMLNLEYDYIVGAMGTYLDTFNATPGITLNRFGEGLTYCYMSFYTGGKKGDPDPALYGVNVTFREAISYTLNYTYIIEEIYAGAVVRGPPVVPRNFYGANLSVTLIDMDVENARDIVKTMFAAEVGGWDSTYPGTDEALWTGLATGPSPLRTFSVNRHYGHESNRKMNVLLEEGLNLIGMTSVETIRQWDDYLDASEYRPWEIQIGYICWGADYLDAINYLSPLFNNASLANHAGLNDPQMQIWLEWLSKQPDATLRKPLYERIQSYLFEANTPPHEWKWPHMVLFTGLMNFVHATALKGVSYNALGDIRCYEWYK